MKSSRGRKPKKQYTPEQISSVKETLNIKGFRTTSQFTDDGLSKEDRRTIKRKLTADFLDENGLTRNQKRNIKSNTPGADGLTVNQKRKLKTIPLVQTALL